MRTRFLVVIFLVPLAVFTQNGRFINKINKVETTFYTEELPTSTSKLDLFDLDTTVLAGNCIGAINSERTKRNRVLLQQDSLLNRIATAGIMSFNKKTFIHSKTWFKEKRSIKYALIFNQSKYRIYSAHAFLLDLLDLKNSQSFYCDKNNQDSPLHLYKGNIPKIINPDDENYVAPEAIEAISTLQLCERLLIFLSRGDGAKDLLSREFSRVGIALKIDKYSLDKNRRPKLFVILIFSGKQLQNVKMPETLKDGSAVSYN